MPPDQSRPMPTDLIRRIDLDLLHPEFLQRLLDLLADAKEQGVHFHVTSGTRLYDEQARLYALYKAGKGGKAAPPGHSQHQWGLAVDVARDADLVKVGLQPRWDAEGYLILAVLAPKHGLHSGASYGDSPHIGWPSYISGADMAPLRKAWLASKGTELKRLKAVWRVVEGDSRTTSSAHRR